MMREGPSYRELQVLPDKVKKLEKTVRDLETTVRELADANNKLVDTINSITHHPTFGTMTNVDKTGFKRAMLRQRSY